jgi:phosphoglycolate phosphatase-like HAD superfamily hydrolase
MHLVMFDIDGTLTQTDDVDAACFAQAIRDVMNLPHIDCDWSRYQHVTDSGIAAEIIQTHFRRRPFAGEIDGIRDRFAQLLREASFAEPAAFQPIPGALKMLNMIGGRSDVAVALATGGWERTARLKLGVAGLNFEQFAFASADDSIQREEIMSIAHVRALQRCRMDAFDSFIYVGDALWDLRASQQLSIPFVAVANGDRAEKLKSQGAEYVLPDFRDYDRFVGILQSVLKTSRRE